MRPFTAVKPRSEAGESFAAPSNRPSRVAGEAAPSFSVLYAGKADVVPSEVSMEGKMVCGSDSVLSYLVSIVLGRSTGNLPSRSIGSLEVPSARRPCRRPSD